MILLRSPEILLALCCFLSWQLNAVAMLPPKLSTATRELRLKEGQTEVVLECELNIGDQPISYRWLKQLKLVTAELGYAYRSYRKVNLALHAITREHAGRYECEATNEAGVDAVTIDIIVEHSDYSHNEGANEFPNTSNILSELAASLNDVLAEGNCKCDVMFMLHASPDAPPETMKAQANFIYTVANSLISDDIRVAVMTYSDYVNSKMNFGIGTNKCALRDAFKDLSHDKWATRIEPVLRDSFKKFKKSKKECKVLMLPIFGSLGAAAVDNIVPGHLKKIGVKLFVFEVTNIPIVGLDKIASTRGDGKPYHWRIPMKTWPAIVSYMQYMPEDLTGCRVEKQVEKPGVCVAIGSNCTQSSQCEGIGFGCIKGVCQSLDCNVRPDLPGCCTTKGDFWCGDVTYDCKPKRTICDGKIQCMNGLDEERCWEAPCTRGQARCQSSVLCLSMYDLCDGEPHCPGAEDEDPRFCRSFPCPSDRFFRCRDGKCISTDSLCDGAFKNCADGEDENLEYCSQKHVCPVSRPFVCDYGVCISDRMVCDGVVNCLDAVDEKLCDDRPCPHDRPFKCGDGKCIELDLVCNGVVDACLDGSDERNCSNFVCPSKRNFKCMNGRCIDRWLRCNRRNDCGDNSDELHCNEEIENSTYIPIRHTTTPRPSVTTTTPCLDDEFFCTQGTCLSREKVCDGNADCPSGEDEEAEMCAIAPCPSALPHKCPDGTCVRAVFCDGNSDCPDGSDEENCLDDEDYKEYDTYFHNSSTASPSQKPDDDMTQIEETLPIPEEEPHPDETQSENAVSASSIEKSPEAATGNNSSSATDLRFSVLVCIFTIILPLLDTSCRWK